MVLATPLGLGKPNQLINALYSRVKTDPSRELRIFTALSLAVPSAGSGLQARFLDPFRSRQWGDDYPELLYLKDLEAGGLPANIHIHEFYLQAGKSVGRPEVQREYVSVNYTHVQYAILDHDVSVLIQLVAKSPRHPGKFSLSCNPDLTLDVIDLYKQNGRKLTMVGVVHPDLPYCAGDSEVDADFFDALVESPEVKHQLFALPRQPISDSDYMIGFHASLLIKDGGTLQIGIGSLSEALVYATLMRHNNNRAYWDIAARLLRERPVTRHHERFELGPFKEGLYGTSEMVMDGFMHLRRGGVLKREVFDSHASIKRWLHGAFYLGSKEFYEWLRELERAGDGGLGMTRVSKVNDLYDEDELALRRQRVKARFFNTCMGATLLGGAASDTREDGAVVSGVGGQFNFVAMSHELPDSLSVLMMRSSRHGPGGLRSNITWGHGQQTIPRHLRDVMITEFGIAFLKNRTDQEVIQAQVAIADARFQGELVQTAVRNGKLDPAWRVPEWARANAPAWPAQFLAEHKKAGLFPAFPFGSDFTPVEERLALALTKLKSASRSKAALTRIFWRGLGADAAAHREALERMGLWRAGGFSERVYRRLLLGVLS
jgi:acyl-CoA hydrolase